MTGTQEKLKYWIFERKIATVLIAEYDGEAVGYALYYPIFGSLLCSHVTELDKITERKVKSQKNMQLSLFNI